MKPAELRALREATEALLGWTMVAHTPEDRALLVLAEHATTLVGIAEDVAQIEGALARKVPAAEVDPLVLAREAVAHHQGIDVINGRWRLNPVSRQPTPAPWAACASVTHPPGEDFRRTVARVLTDPESGEVVIGTSMTQGKAETEWANAELIARMREREPVIAAEVVRLAAEVEQRLAALVAEQRGRNEDAERWRQQKAELLEEMRGDQETIATLRAALAHATRPPPAQEPT